MRGTAYYQWASQAAVVFDIKVDSLNLLLILIIFLLLEFSKLNAFTF
jgi:hypothetical protein